MYAGEDLPSEDAPEPLDVDVLLEGIGLTFSLEELREVYFAAIKMAHGNQSVIKQLELAKDARKKELTEAGVNE